LEVIDSYVSVTEVSEYATEMSDGMKKPRLYPKLPIEGKTAWCFYPMSKRRGETENWYALPYEQRKELIHQHGASGRKYADRVQQLVTGSTGLDDWEWGVTLFAVTPDDLKDVVYAMRYDEASTRFGEFGTFYTGMVGSLGDVLNVAGIE
jgi:chlorite dismutase